MVITSEVLVTKLSDYLHRAISLSELVDWAELAMMEGEFDEANFEVIRNIVAQLGLADVRAFGINWDDCIDMFEQLGYKAQLQIAPL